MNDDRIFDLAYLIETLIENASPDEEIQITLSQRDWKEVLTALSPSYEAWTKAV